MKTVLFVCTGNVCRSPMAEGLLRHAVQHLPHIQVESAGVSAVNGHPPSLNAIEALREIGIDISAQRSRVLTAEMVGRALYIFGMTRGHVDAVNYLYPGISEKTFLLREFDRSLAGHETDILDPIGSSLENYARCRDEIIQGINSIRQMLSEETPIPPLKFDVRTPLRVFLGSDHAGFRRKEALKELLAERAIRFEDCGAFSPDPTDYPDQAAEVCRQVLSHRNAYGLLMCGTGIGMSIAANKVPGIRAALAMDIEAARLARKHNNANVLCLPGRTRECLDLGGLLDAFVTTPFEGGRHAQRLDKIRSKERAHSHPIFDIDPAIAVALQQELRRQRNTIELIASENFTSPAVMAAQGSVLTNKYAEGYPKKRWYGGCEYADAVEQLAIDRAKQLFQAQHANVQPHSGSSANMAVYFAMLDPGDLILTMDLSHGGHLTHGNKVNFSGRFFKVIHYGVSREGERIDYDELENLARTHRPKMITVGASAYPRTIDFERLGAIARQAGALLLADIAHIAGLVVSGLHPSPVLHADFVTTTTHKTLRGPRGGLIVCKSEYAKAIDSQIFPGIQGGPLMHVIAAKAVCFQEALQPSFHRYQRQILENAKALASGLLQNGYRLVSGGTDNHLMLVDVGEKGMTGKACQHALDQAGITVNKNTIPFETRSPFQASGIRIGTPAVTTRGMKTLEMTAVADMISEILMDPKNIDAIQKVRHRVLGLTARFPLPY